MILTDANLFFLVVPAGCDLLDDTIGQLWVLLVIEPTQGVGDFGALTEAGSRDIDVAALPGCPCLKDSLLHLCLDLSMLRCLSTTGALDAFPLRI